MKFKYMDELIKTFHIEANLLLAQIVNFVIVLLVLYKVAYKPVLKTLNERTGKIEKGMEDAEESRKKLENALQLEKEILTQAKKEAQGIIRKAEDNAKKNADSFALETKEKTDKMIAEAKKIIEQEKNKMFTELKMNIAGLVVSATEKVLEEKIDHQKDQGIIARSIK